jgi:hypothetical protein
MLWTPSFKIVMTHFMMTDLTDWFLCFQMHCVLQPGSPDGSGMTWHDNDLKLPSPVSDQIIPISFSSVVWVDPSRWIHCTGIIICCCGCCPCVAAAAVLLVYVSSRHTLMLPCAVHPEK